MLWQICLVVLATLTRINGFNLPSLPKNYSVSDEVLSTISDDIANKFTDEYIRYLKTGVESAALRQISNQLATSHSKKHAFTQDLVDLTDADQFFVCTTCRATVNVAVRMFRDPNGELNGANAEEDIKPVLLDICARFDIQTEEVCAGLFDVNWPFLEYIIQNSSADSRTLCGLLPIRACSVRQQEYNWTLTIDNSGPALEGPKSEIPNKSVDDLKIVQITDIHYDADYVPGSLAECAEPLCCRRPANDTTPVEQQAGYWSDYRDCDAPLHLIVNALDHIKSTQQRIDYIYQTGDIVPHNVWATTKEGNLELLTEINTLIESKFPDIPVYPVIGNHEPHPTNVFGGANVPEELQVEWLYEHLYNLWSKWLPADTKSTILKGGYYTVSPKSGFRIISLNNNDCYLYNFWLYHEGTVAIEQLQWLHDTLLAAEKANEYVHILAHIPAGSSDCWTVWSREFNRLIVRFNRIIGGIFNGHTHRDELSVHYSEQGYAIGVSWNGGSLTSYSYKNPNYRVYQVEPTTLLVVDHETWITNLTDANAKGVESSPVWYKEYQFSEFTENLTPNGIDILLERFSKQPQLLYKYWTYKVTSADPKLEEGCDNQCLLNTICNLAVSVNDKRSRCEELQEELKKHLEYDTTVAPETTASTASPGPTSPGTTVTTESTTESDDITTPEDDGAAVLSSLKITTIIGIFLFMRCLL